MQEKKSKNVIYFNIIFTRVFWFLRLKSPRFNNILISITENYNVQLLKLKGNYKNLLLYCIIK